MSFVEIFPRYSYQTGAGWKLLSGGQRPENWYSQSFTEPKILILDEPTSALDIESEYDFMMLLRKLKSQVLIIVISHRPSALKYSINNPDAKWENRISWNISTAKRDQPGFIDILDKCTFLSNLCDQQSENCHYYSGS